MSMADVPEFNVGQLKDLREDIHSLLYRELMSTDDDLTDSETLMTVTEELADKLINKFLRRLRPDMQPVWEQVPGH